MNIFLHYTNTTDIIPMYFFPNKMNSGLASTSNVFKNGSVEGSVGFNGKKIIGIYQ